MQTDKCRSSLVELKRIKICLIALRLLFPQWNTGLISIRTLTKLFSNMPLFDKRHLSLESVDRGLSLEAIN